MMKVFAESGCCFLIFVLLFTGLAISNPVNSLAADEREWSKRNCFKDEPPTTLRVNEGDPFKLTCRPLDDCPHSRIYWVRQFSNGTTKSIDDSRITLDPEGNLWFSNVTQLDATGDFHYACAVDLPSLRESKIGNRALLNVATSNDTASSIKREPARQYVSKANEIALRGTDFELKDFELFCIYGGTPLPVAVWSKNGQRIRPNDRIIERNYGKSLLIRNVNFDDKGVYACDVSNGVGIAQSYSIDLDVQSAPFLVLEPASADVAENETVEIVCEAAGVPEPKVEWTYNGRPLAEAPSNPRRSEQPGRLALKNLKKEDAGEYGCNATNSHGYVHKDAYVNVMALAPEILRSPKDDAAVEGKTAKMTCRVVGAPEPAVEWVRNGQELTGERYETMRTGELQIRNVMFTDAGEYTCIASNRFGSVNATGSLAVKERTRIVDWPLDREVAAGGTARFRCGAVADPTLLLRFDWQRNGEPIDFESEPRFLLGNDNSLMITKTTELDSGTYTCVASADLDEARAQATLVVQDVPNAPTLLGVACGSNEAHISWTPTSDNRSPILRFSIQSNTSFTPDTWEIANDHVPATDQSYAIKLSPGTNYTFRVIAWNKIGASEPSSHSSVCTTVGDAPYENHPVSSVPGAVTGLDADPVGPTAMTLKWNKPIEINGTLTGYKITYQKITGSEVGLEMEVHPQIRDPEATSAKLSGLSPQTKYRITIRATTNVGEGEPYFLEKMTPATEDRI